MPSLTSLNVRNCEKLTDTAMKAVATLPELRSLRIFGCRKLTDESIKTLAGCAKLTTLDTTNTFRQIFKRVAALLRLRVSDLQEVRVWRCSPTKYHTSRIRSPAASSSVTVCMLL